jgi:SanA protein
MADEVIVRQRRLIIMKRFLIFLVVLVLTFVAVNVYIVKSTDADLYHSLENIPSKEFCLVLGASPYRDACKNRLRAAAELFKAGKVKHVILSGDNSRKSYNEPQGMKKQLLKLGVPENKITLDYAGFRTLDSVYRANHVFDAQSVIIVTQEFHANRAIYLAQAYGLESVAYLADKTVLESTNRTREYGARVLAFIDVMIGREAHFSGPREPVAIK